MTAAAIRTPKVCFSFVQPKDGGTVKVFGETDEIVLDAGMWPNVVKLRVPKAEYLKLGGDFVRSGDIELFWQSAHTPDVRLRGWSIDHVEDSYAARLPEDGDDTPAQIVEKTLYLLDRRWEFRNGRGGYVSAPIVINQVTPDGKNVFNPAGYGFSAAGDDYGSLLKSLCLKVKCCSKSPVPNVDLPDWAAMTAIPREVKWQRAHIPSEIQRMLEEIEAVWVLRTDGTYNIEMIGVGAEPAPLNMDGTPAVALPKDLNRCRSDAPEICVVSGQPSRTVVVETLGGIGTTDDSQCCWEYVGKDIDGAYRPLEKLSYVKAAGTDPLTFFRERVLWADPEEYPQGADLAIETFYCVIRLTGPRSSKAGGVERLLPLVGMSPKVGGGADGERQSAYVRVMARGIMQAGPYGLWWPATALTERADFDVDPANGTIWFKRRLMCPGQATYDPASDMLPLGVGDLTVEFAHEIDEYFDRAWRRDANGTLQAVSVADTLGGADRQSNFRIVSDPWLRRAIIDGSPVNDAVLQDRALAIAGTVLKAEPQVETRRLVGMHDVSPNGRIPTVRWNLREGITSYEWRTYWISRNRYVERKAFHDVAARASAGERGAAVAPAAISRGSAGYVPPTLRSPGGADMLPGPPLLMRGLVAPAWSWQPWVKTVDVVPADHKWAALKDAKSVTCKFLSSDQCVMGAQVSAGQHCWFFPDTKAESGAENDTGFVVGLGIVPPLALFPVLLAMTGGLAGDKDTQCSFVYRAQVVTPGGAGMTVGQNLTPQAQRPARGTMVSGDGKYGSGYVTADGTFVLVWANETLAVIECPEG